MKEKTKRKDNLREIKKHLNMNLIHNFKKKNKKYPNLKTKHKNQKSRLKIVEKERKIIKVYNLVLSFIISFC